MTTLIEVTAVAREETRFLLSSIRLQLSNLEDRMLKLEEGVDIDGLVSVQAKLELLHDLTNRIAAIERQQQPQAVGHLDARLTALEGLRAAINEQLSLFDDKLTRIDNRLLELLDLNQRVEKLYNEHGVLAAEVARLSLAENERGKK